MSYWVYKCNVEPLNGPDSGDWDYVFQRMRSGEWKWRHGVGWGTYSEHPELADLEPGDLVIANQTGSRKTLVGVVEYVGDTGSGKNRRAKLRPVEEIRTKIPPLKKANPKIAAIRALEGGEVKTLYGIKTADAKRLLAAARAAQKDRTAVAIATVKGRVKTLERKIAAYGAGFGDPESNLKVERAAVKAVTRRYADEGWSVVSVEQEKIGYDLQCRRVDERHHVEVKGVRGSEVAFFITAAEMKQWKSDVSCRIAVVTKALTKPTIQIYGRADLTRFQVQDVLLRARLK